MEDWVFVEDHLGVPIFHNGKVYGADPFNGVSEQEVEHADLRELKGKVNDILSRTYYDVIRSIMINYDIKGYPWESDTLIEKIEDFYIDEIKKAIKNERY